MPMHDMVLIKLGGSVVTFKDKPLSANKEAINRISEALAQIKKPAIIVHGGGSFGHHWSVKYDMHTKPADYDPHGVAVVHESMIALNQIIVNSMIRQGLNPYGLPPSVFTSGHRPILGKIRDLLSMAKSGVMPVTFGDVVHFQGEKYSIFSGDALMTVLARAIRPSRVIFATNVDGIYSDLATRTLVPTINAGRVNSSIKITNGGVADVTGGMQRKITEAFKIASSGMDVMLVNGLFPDRIVDAAQGKSTTGSRIRKRSGA